ncbi:MAG: hypothetical protein R2747_08615 [Pyrinomonadaceae bacterium]
MTVSILFIVGFLGISILVLVLLIFLWPRKGKMGINLSKVVCPDCGKSLPTIRKPKNARQMMWGGWTCDACGCEVDKYGKRVDADEGIET